MSEVSIIGIDLAKQVFHLHGSGSDGSIVFRKQVSRSQVRAFLEKHRAVALRLKPVRRRMIGGDGLGLWGTRSC